MPQNHNNSNNKQHQRPQPQQRQPQQQPVDVDDDALEAIAGGLLRHRLPLECCVLGDLEADAPPAAAARDANLGALAALLARAPGDIRYAPRPGDAAGLFPAVGKDGTAAYAGPLTIVDASINVRVYKKVNPEAVAYNASSWELKRWVKPDAAVSWAHGAWWWWWRGRGFQTRKRWGSWGGSERCSGAPGAHRITPPLT